MNTPTPAEPVGPQDLRKFLCAFCAGHGFVPTEEGGIGTCDPCGGSGYACACGDLGPTRSEKSRPYIYEPGCRRLTLAGRSKPTEYTVSEFAPDRQFPGRAFQLHKRDGEVYSVLIGHEGCLCDCAGKSYESAARANFRAWLTDRAQFGTLGCKHLDSVSRLLVEGWLDLPESTYNPTLPDECDVFG